jgi:hypothetical protein
VTDPYPEKQSDELSPKVRHTGALVDPCDTLGLIRARPKGKRERRIETRGPHSFAGAPPSQVHPYFWGSAILTRAALVTNALLKSGDFPGVFAIARAGSGALPCVEPEGFPLLDEPGDPASLIPFGWRCGKRLLYPMELTLDRL